MTIVYDNATEQQRSASAATTTFAHVAGAGVKGVLVAFVRAATTTDNITAVSYGGTNLVRVNRATDTTTEAGEASWWFAPHTTAGSQNVAYNAGVTGSNIHVVAITVTGDGTPFVVGQQTKAVDNTASSSVSLTTGYVSGLAFGAIYWGGADATTITPGSGSELIHHWDMGAFGSYVHRLTTATTAGTGPLLEFGTSQGSDELA